ncbi:DUF5011 domain-containing protein [Parapedobacter sp. GCM10030251]|uniref:DUF5011 domain-containing protein n=1 Tax=Parapedobacter sp. GCM10030251 TaxID=3273419 RepID=UPI00360DE57E
MRKYIWGLVATIVALQGCEKLESEGVSFETQFVDIQLNGDAYMSVPLGEEFVDEGAVAKEGEEEKPVTVSGNVNVNTVGVYEVKYSAVNNDGYPGSVTRIVAVIPAAEQEGVNIAGSYKYNGNVYVGTITKYAPGFYYMNNLWGPSPVPCYILTSNGKDLILPLTNTSFGRVLGSGTLTGNALALTVSLLDQNGLIDVPRNWTKQ